MNCKKKQVISSHVISISAAAYGNGLQVVPVVFLCVPSQQLNPFLGLHERQLLRLDLVIWVLAANLNTVDILEQIKCLLATCCQISLLRSGGWALSIRNKSM